MSGGCMNIPKASPHLTPGHRLSFLQHGARIGPVFLLFPLEAETMNHGKNGCNHFPFNTVSSPAAKYSILLPVV